MLVWNMNSIQEKTAHILSYFPIEPEEAKAKQRSKPKGRGEKLVDKVVIANVKSLCTLENVTISLTNLDEEGSINLESNQYLLLGLEVFCFSK